jgi:signal transduction histidine kinase
VIVGVAAVAVGCLSALAVAVAPHDGTAPPVLTTVTSVLGGWSFAAVALLLPVESVTPRTRVLLLGVGLSWLAGAASFVDEPSVRLFGLLVGNVWLAVLAHLLLVYPGDRAVGRASRAGIAAAYLLTGPGSVLVLAGGRFVARVLVGVATAQMLFGFALVVLLVRRWRALSAPARRAAGPVLLGGGALVVGLILVQAAHPVVADPAALSDLRPGWVEAVVGTVLLLVPAGFATAVGRAHLDRVAVADLAVALDRAVTAAQLRGALAHALRDPGLRVAYWLPLEGRYVDDEGRPVTLPDGPGTEAVSVLESDGRPVAALVHEAGPPQRRRLVEAVAASARMALHNARLRAELSAQLAQVRASRARIAAAADAERRRIERNIHDGAQQRLVNATLALALAHQRLDRTGLDRDSLAPVLSALDDTATQLRHALADLRETARGVHPAILTGAGLGPAVEALAERSRVPVVVTTDLPGRLAEPVEEAAYYAVAEALANVTKHARATSAVVALRVEAGRLVVTVTDDGVGGADPDRGTGLRGLADRVAAVGGRLDLFAPVEGGTLLRVEVPCGS